MNNPYIGITDFTNAEQVRDMLSVFTHPHRRLHVGVMMSYKTLHGISSKNTGVFPENTMIRDIFFPHKQLMCTVHYVDFNRGKTNLVRYPLENAIGFGGPHMNALQLDMTWPDPSAVADAIAASGKISRSFSKLVPLHLMRSIMISLPYCKNCSSTRVSSPMFYSTKAWVKDCLLTMNFLLPTFE